MAARLGVVIAIAWGCSSSPAPPATTEKPPAPRPAPPAAVPAEAPPGTAATETWTGMGFQPSAGDASRWSIELHLHREAAVGMRLGTIEYPSLGCSGELIREPDRDGAMVAIERLTVNPDDVCIDGGTIVLRILGEGLEYRWYERSGAEGATATLLR